MAIQAPGRKSSNKVCLALCWAAVWTTPAWSQSASGQTPSLPPPPETVSEQARAQLSAMASVPDGPAPTLAQMRSLADQFQLAWSAKQKMRYPVTISEETLGAVAVRIISPSQGSADQKRVLLDLHGGGFQLDSGSLTENVPIAAITGIPVIAVRYRLAPENHFPAAVDDALAVYRMLLKSHAPTDIAVYGTSAGAVLGPELIARILAERLPVPAALGVFSGDADLARSGDSAQLFPFKMGNLKLPSVLAAYAGTTSLKDPSLSPLYGSLEGFPPTLCITSGRDFMLSGTINFCRALQLQGGAANTVVFDGLPHAFWTYIDAPESDDAFKLMANFLVAQLQTAGRRASSDRALQATAPSSATASPPATDELAQRCESLTGAHLPGTSITSARIVEAGPFKSAFMATAVSVPAHCRVEGRISAEAGSDIRFEVWMPVKGWNGRLYGAGNGGFGGAISYSPGLVETVQHGAAGVSTDTGHAVNSPRPAEDGSWAQGHPERVKDFGFRAIHLSTKNAQALISAFYGEPARRSYFASCSNGGRAGLMEAERYPEDYDGIIAGAPAYDWTGITADFIWNTQAVRQPGGAIPVSKVPAIQAAVRRACNIDGGFVHDPLACHFDPVALLCKSGDSDSCLTAQQVDALKKIYAGPRNSKGNSLYPGFPPSGAELGAPPGSGWDGWLLAPAGGDSNQERYPREMLKYFTTDLPTDMDHFDFDRDYPVLKSQIAPVIDAVDTDLTRFAARGGKLILWHGWADPALPPQHTIDYFKRVRGTIGATKANTMLRLFMVPGVQHCFGGPGPNAFGQFNAPPDPSDPQNNLAAALERWVEQGRAPEAILATHSANPLQLDPEQATAENAELVCAYPDIAVSTYKGDFAPPDSFRCQAPGRGGRH